MRPRVVRVGQVVVVGVACLVLAVAGCGGGDEAAEPDTSSGTSAEPTSTTGGTDRTSTTSTTVRTTPTSHAPDTVEGQVEQAYLEAWDVYLSALDTADASQLSTIYAGEALTLRQGEISRLIADGQAVEGSVEHSYSVAGVQAGVFAVVDLFQNHLVLVDATTRRPLEADPDKPQRQTFVLNRQGDRWVVTGVFN